MDLFVRQAAPAQKLPHLARLPALQILQQDLVRRAMGQRLQLGDHFWPKTAVPATGEGIDHVSPTDGHAGRGLADDEPVAFDQGHRVLQPELYPAFVPRAKDPGAEQPHLRLGLGCATEKVHLGIVLEGDWGIRQIAQMTINQRRRHEPSRRGHHVSALNQFLAYPGQVDGHATAGYCLLYLLLVGLQAPNANFEP